MRLQFMQYTLKDVVFSIVCTLSWTDSFPSTFWQESNCVSVYIHTERETNLFSLKF